MKQNRLLDYLTIKPIAFLIQRRLRKQGIDTSNPMAVQGAILRAAAKRQISTAYWRDIANDTGHISRFYEELFWDGMQGAANQILAWEEQRKSFHEGMK